MPVKKGLSNLQRTLAACRDMGRVVDKTEYFNPYGGMRIKNKFTGVVKPTGVRVDVFNFIDALALGLATTEIYDLGIGKEKIRKNGIIAIQACGSDFSGHKRKILENEFAKRWLECGGYIEIWGWRKLKLERGGKAMRWAPRVEQITLQNFIQKGE